MIIHTFPGWWYDWRVSIVRTEIARRGRLYILASLLAMMATFAIGARSWTQFYLSPHEANGVPTRLFTNTDYPAIAIASRIVASGEGGQLYDLDMQRREQDALAVEGSLYQPQGLPLKYPYPYTPFIAVLWSPLAGLSPLMGMALWDLLNIAALVAGLWYLLSSLPLPRVTQVLLLLGALTSFPWIVNLEQGQSSGIVIGVLSAGVALLRKERDLQGGLLLGLLALKTQWLPFIVLLLIWKLRWRALLGMAATILSLILLVIATMGMDWIPDFVQIVDMVQHWDRALLLDPWFSHSLSGGFGALLGRGSDEVVRIVMLLATLSVISALAFLWRGRWLPGTPKWDGAIALTLLATIFTNLQLNTHDLVLLVMPGALGLSYLHSLPNAERLKMAWYALLWVCYLVPAFFLEVAFEWPIRVIPLFILAMLAVLTLTLRKPAYK